MQLISSDKKRLVLGLGKTGFSCVRFLRQQSFKVSVCDTREMPPYLTQCQQQFPEVDVRLGELDTAYLQQFDQIVISPGLALAHPAIQSAQQAGVEIIGDVDLFVQYQQAKIIAITGSNAKSTVTSLTGFLLEKAGFKVKIGGNLGQPMLELLDDTIEFYVLELSSFQLETTAQLNASVATCLNVSEDHMDRYERYVDYYLAKHRIFKGANAIVINKDDPLSTPLIFDDCKKIFFSTRSADLHQYGLGVKGEHGYLMRGFKQLIDTQQLKLMGKHNYSNYLAALALCEACEVDVNTLIPYLAEFSGLEHRCQQVANIDGVVYINDSKATNVGACMAAIEGLAGQRMHLILGGVTKGADFSKLVSICQQQVSTIAFIGEGAQYIADTLKHPNSIFCKNLQQAVEQLAVKAVAGDVVMLSPACASFDMFASFEDRGEQFKQIVQAML